MLPYRNLILFFVAICSSLITLQVQAQEAKQSGDPLYRTAMEQYESKNWPAATKSFIAYLDTVDLKSVSKSRLYNGACILALGEQPERSLKLLNHLADVHLYSNLDHLKSDSDLESLRAGDQWAALVAKVAQNKKTQPARTRALVKSELLKAKSLLQADNGKLWGQSIWCTDILVLDFDHTIYSLEKLADSQVDGVLYYKTVEPNDLSFTNSAQTYNGKRYAVVMVNYLEDQSSTIIHELFHVLQLSHRQYRSDPVKYLDNHDAREWLRLEFQALRNALKAAGEKRPVAEVKSWLADAVRFRKIRQSEHPRYLQDELEIETLEGMANYTGIVLSSKPNKFETAIKEINGREKAATYTRPFPYATGPAYGLLFDHLKVNWKSDMQTIYNFLKIYETHLGEPVKTDNPTVQQAKARNNYSTIHQEELAKKLKQEKFIKHYTQTLLKRPTLRANVTGGTGSYSTSFDMNGTLVLGDHGIVYSHIKGVDLAGTNFGSFQSTGDDTLGSAGILRLNDGGELVFPYPTKIDGQKIVGEFYEMELNEGWQARKNSESGNLEIVPVAK